MKKLKQVFVLLSLFHILLCLLSFQIHLAEARLRHLGENRSLISKPPPQSTGCVKPSPPCRASLSSQGKPCVIVRRPPRKPVCSPRRPSHK
ncbi:hypothetical protein Bca101_045211 [Brassica carinata]